ncbi:MAG: hypothetical protein FH751_14985 [Firmicutes bacterium]|nr:hypothetical protein [Bacillota bacterium]
MFGYITPFKPELKIKEYDVFKGYYCGICKEMGREFNQLVRLGLNYDLTFLGLLLSSLDSEKVSFKREGCITNPIKKKPVLKSNKHIEYASNMGIILVYFKLIDDWKDEKKITALFASLPYHLSLKKAKYKFPKKFKEIKTGLDKLYELESTNCKTLDKSAHAFGKIMETIACPPYISSEDNKRVLSWLGYNLGRWIYILDAYDDLAKDVEKENYNAILLKYGYNEGENLKEFKSKIKDEINFGLTFTLDNIAKSFQLLDIKYNKNLLENIIYLGARHKTNTIIEKGCDKCEGSI